MQEDEVIYEDLQMTEVQNDTTIEEIIPVVEVADIETFNIEILEAFPASGEIDTLNHALLNNRELHDAHPIAAITGLRDELDSIEALQTIYSDKKGNADYYEWDDGNNGADNRTGLFVTLDKKVRTISICSGDDIFGVVVDEAAFIGGQDEIARDAHYGLVATTGAVHVRCELDVADGDYVVSNAYGVATKSASNRGYRVVALHDINGVPHATIKLHISADQVDAMGTEIQGLGTRMKTAETNIISAINVANEAYSKASEMISVSTDAAQKAQDALDTSQEVLDSVGSLENAATQSQIIAAQAKAIADSAMVSAESMCNQAIEDANNALAEASKLREDIKETIGNLDSDLIDSLNQMKDLVEDLEPLATWPEGATGDNIKGITGFVARADEDSATLASIVKWQGETNESIAGIRQEVSENYATQEMVSAVGDNLAFFKQEVKDDYATQEMVTQVGGALASFQQQVTDNYATNTSLANLKTETTDAIVASEEKATKTYASKSDLTSFEGATNTAIANIQQKADANGAYIQSTVANMDKYSVGPHSQAHEFTWEQATDVLAEGMIYVPTEEVTEEYLYASSVAGNFDWSNPDNNMKTKVYYDEQDDFYLYYTRGQWYFSDDFPTETRTFLPHYLYMWGRPQGSELCKWITVDKNYNPTDEVNTSAPAVHFTTTMAPTIGENDDYGYWYTNGSTLTGTAIGYEPYTLYKWMPYEYGDGNGEEGLKTDYHWVAVATLAGNSQSRAVSQIKQTANSIETSVTTLDGKYAGTKSWVDTNRATIQETVKWKTDNATSIATFMSTASDKFVSTAQVAEIVDEDGNIKAASIVTAVNDSGSGVTIRGDKINISGNTTFSALYNEVSEVTTIENNHTVIDGGKIKTNSITAAQINGTNLNVVNGTFSGTLSSPTGQIGGWELGKDYLKLGNIGEQHSFYLGTQSLDTPVQMAGTYANNWRITVGDRFGVNPNGLYCTSGCIGGWTINDNSLYKGTTVLYGSDLITCSSLVSDGLSPYRFSCGAQAEGNAWGTLEIQDFKDGNNQYTIVLPRVQGNLTDFDVRFISEEYYDENDDWCADNIPSNSYVVESITWATCTVTIRIIYTRQNSGKIYLNYSAQYETIPPFAVLEDGSLYAQAIQLGTKEFGSKNNVYIGTNDKSGTISDVRRDDWRLAVGSQFGVTSDGYLFAQNADVAGAVHATSGDFNGAVYAGDGQIGGFQITNSALIAQSAMKIQGGNNTYIGLNTISGGTAQTTTINMQAWGKDGKIHLRLTSTKALLEDATFHVRIRMITSNVSFESLLWTSTTKFTIKKGTKFSEWFTPWANSDIWDLYWAGQFEANFTHLVGDYNDADLVSLSNLWNASEASPYTYTGNSGYASFDFTQDTSSQIEIKGNVVPTTINSERSGYSIGNDERYWNSITCFNLTQKSDKNLKNTISDLNESYSRLFDKLRPVTYKFNDGTSGRLHTGFIAQEIGDALNEVGIDSQDFAAYCDYECEDGTHTYALRYTEFIPLAVSEIQKLKKRVAELEAHQND